MKAILKKINSNLKSFFRPKNNVLIGISIISTLIIISLFIKKSIPIRILQNSDPRTSKPNEICMQIEDSYLFDLFKLSEIQNPLQSIYINLQFCKNINNELSSCVYNGEKKNIRLAGDIHGEVSNYNKIEVTWEQSKRILNYYLAAGDKCAYDQKQNYKVNIKLECDKDQEFSLSPFVFDPKTSCTLDIKAKTKYACGEEKYKSYIIHEIADGIILLVIGIFLGFLGYKAVAVNIVIVFLVIFGFLGLMIINLAKINSKAIMIVIFVAAGIIAIAFSVLFIIKKKVLLRYFMLLVCGLCGFIFGELLFDILFALIDTKHQEVVHYVIIGALIVVGVIVGVFLPKYTLIIGTSFIGSYLIMRGIACFLTKNVPFVDERKIYDLAHSGNFDKINHMIVGLFLIYPGIVVFFMIITIIVQIKINPNWKEMDYKELNQNINNNVSPVPDYVLGEDDD